MTVRIGLIPQANETWLLVCISQPSSSASSQSTLSREMASVVVLSSDLARS